MTGDRRYKRAKAIEWALGHTSQNKEQIAVCFQLLDATEGPDRITWYGYFTEKTWERTIESLRHCGWEGDDLSDLSGLDTNEVDLVIEPEENDRGEWYDKVRWVNSRGGLALKDRMDEGEVKAFAQRMRGNILAMKKGGGQRSRTQRSGNSRSRSEGAPPAGHPDDPGPSDFDEDSIPF